MVDFSKMNNNPIPKKEENKEKSKPTIEKKKTSKKTPVEKKITPKSQIPSFSELLLFAKEHQEFDECRQFVKYNLSREEYLKLYGRNRGGGGTRGNTKLTLDMVELYNKNGGK